MAKEKSKVPKASAPPKNRKAIRIALFGRRSAGKTCFLAALAMQRTPHRKGLDCTLKQVEEGDHPAFQRGKAKIEEAKDRISNGEAPRPTPNSDLLAFHLRVGAQRNGDTADCDKVEMVDYSGELLDTSDFGDLAKLLTEHLRESDAMIVLAEYPGHGKEAEQIPRELDLLGQAFHRVRNNCPKLPVAFVVNKWDRNPALHDHEATLEEQSRHLQEFLSTEPLPFHCRLRDRIKSATGERFREFPVSVFGESRIEESVDETGKKEFREVPVMQSGMLNSFGLDDALCWLTQEVKRVRARKRRRIRAAISGVLVMLLSFALVWDEYRYRGITGIISSPAATDEEIENAESELGTYADSANLRHLFMHQYRPANEIEDLIDQSREAREQRAWETVQGLQEPKEQMQAADEYLAAFPQGRFHIAARKMIENQRALERETEAKTLVGSLQTDLEAIRQQAVEESLSSIADLESRISKALEQYTLPSDLLAQVKVVQAELRTLRVKAITAKNLADRKQEFETLFIEEGKALEAGQLLASLPGGDHSNFEPEIRQYRGLALEKLETQLNRESLGGRGWASAIESLNTFLEIIAKPHRELLLPEDAMNQLERIKSNIETQGDRYLYEIAHDEPDSRKVAALETYLAEAPVKAMQQECEKMLGYFRDLEKEQELTLILESIRWGEKVDQSEDNWVEIEIGYRALEAKGPFSATRGEVSRPPGDSSWPLGKRKIDEQISILIKISDHGKGRFNLAGLQGSTGNPVAVILKDLSGGRDFPLSHNKHGTSEVRLRVEGIPTRPDLPPYHPPQIATEMPENELILFLETPRAGGERGHRWLTPGASRPVAEGEITEWTRLLEQPEETDKIVVTRRQVGQVIGGNTRDAWESLAAVNLPSLDSGQRGKITGLLREFLDRFDPDRIDWERGSGLVVSTTELDPLYFELQKLVLTLPDRTTPHPSHPETRQSEGAHTNSPPKAKRSKKGSWLRFGRLALAAGALLVLWAFLKLLPDGSDSGGQVEGDPVWNSFLAFREETLLKEGADIPTPIEDAKFLWENLTVARWSGGDFLRTDLSRNSPEATKFLGLGTPQIWYLDAAYDHSHAAQELRAIRMAVGGSLKSDGTLFERGLVKAIADSAEKLKSADLENLDRMITQDLERAKQAFGAIPENTRLDWPTPADGERARVLFNAIVALSRTAPPERRIQTWRDVFEDEVIRSTVVAAEADSEPVAKIQWTLLKPLVEWNRSSR